MSVSNWLDKVVSPLVKMMAASLLLTATLPVMAQDSDTVQLSGFDYLEAHPVDTFDVTSVLETSRSGITPTPTGRPTHRIITELARALSYDADTIEEFIHDHVDIHGTFGLSKGAVGTAIDLDGNAFDQAHLMGELLKVSAANGASISNIQYQYGQLNLTQQEFDDWYGITSSNEACKFLGSGGFPAVVNSQTNCNNLSGTVSLVTMAHLWVTATVDGQARTFNPSYKRYEKIEALDIVTTTLAGVDDAVLAKASIGHTSGMDGTLPWVKDLNYDEMTGQLNATSKALYDAINEQAYDASIEQLIGGRTIIRRSEDDQAEPTGLTALQTWSAIPDSYRTLIRVKLTKGQSTSANYWEIIDGYYFADEIYGRRFAISPDAEEEGLPVIETDATSYGTPQGLLKMPIGLMLDDERIGDEGAFIEAINHARRRAFGLKLAIDHPYPAEAAEYADELNFHLVDLLSNVVIMSSFGGIGNSTVELSKDRLGGEKKSFSHWYSGADEPVDPRDLTGTGNQTNHIRYSLASEWIDQSYRVMKIQSYLFESPLQNHHSIGVVSARTFVLSSFVEGTSDFIEPFSNGRITPGTDASASTSIGDETLNFHISTKLSTVLDSGEKASLSIFSATLESVLLKNMSGAVDAISTSSRFAWANNGPIGNPALESNDFVVEDTGPTDSFAGPFKFFHVSSTNLGELGEHMTIDGQQVCVQDADTTGVCLPLNYEDLLGNHLEQVDSYAVFPADLFLGPGMRCGYYYPRVFHQSALLAEYERDRAIAQQLEAYAASGSILGGLDIINSLPGPTGDSPVVQAANCERSLLRGTSIYAYGSNVYRNYSIYLSGYSKGGGVGAAPEEITGAEFNIPGKKHNVNPYAANISNTSGLFRYSTGELLKTGVGSMPQSLSLSATLNTAQRAQKSYLWDHNWNLSADMRGDVGMILGDHRPISTISTLVALKVVAGMSEESVNFNGNNHERLLLDVSSQLVVNWWSETADNNVVDVSLGANTLTFVRKPWAPSGAIDEFISPPGSNSKLSQFGQRRLAWPENGGHVAGNLMTSGSRPVSREWRVRPEEGEVPVSFTYTSIDGAEIDFEWVRDRGEPYYYLLTDPSPRSAIKGADSFRAKEWRFPTGEKINFTYNDMGRLTTVTNNYGRGLNFSHSLSMDEGGTGPDVYPVETLQVTAFDGAASGGPGPAGSGGTGRTVTLVDGDITHPDGSKTILELERIWGTGRKLSPAKVLIKSVSNANDVADGGEPSYRIEYDALDRVKSLEYANSPDGASAKTYTGGEYKIAAGRRTAIVDALGNESVSIYDEYGRVVEMYEPSYEPEPQTGAAQ